MCFTWPGESKACLSAAVSMRALKARDRECVCVRDFLPAAAAAAASAAVAAATATVSDRQTTQIPSPTHFARAENGQQLRTTCFQSSAASIRQPCEFVCAFVHVRAQMGWVKIKKRKRKSSMNKRAPTQMHTLGVQAAAGQGGQLLAVFQDHGQRNMLTKRNGKKRGEL